MPNSLSGDKWSGYWTQYEGRALSLYDRMKTLCPTYKVNKDFSPIQDIRTEINIGQINKTKQMDVYKANLPYIRDYILNRHIYLWQLSIIMTIAEFIWNKFWRSTLFPYHFFIWKNKWGYQIDSLTCTAYC
jgi:hypothetical protein